MLVAQQSEDNGTCTSTLLSSNQQRSVLHAVHAEKPPSSLTYTPYGHRALESEIASLPGFTGERADSVTQHYPLGQGYRWFNPVLMRFNSPDSLSPFGHGGLNPYVYCLGDPINRVDPNGRTPFWMAFGRSAANVAASGLEFSVASVKPIINFKEIAPGISIFESTQKMGKRLNIMADSVVVNKRNYSKTLITTSDGVLVTPEDLFKRLKMDNVNIDEYSDIRLFSDNLASDGDFSFASQFSGITQKTITAFNGPVTAGIHPVFRPPVPIGFIDKSVDSLVIHKSMLRHIGHYNKVKITPPKKSLQLIRSGQAV